MCRVANLTRDLTVAFAEVASSILTIDRSNAWRGVITPKKSSQSIILSRHTASALHKGNLGKSQLQMGSSAGDLQ